jgi:electron transport complex protein RnfE
MNNKYSERLFNGIVKENPTFVLMLGMCPTLAVTILAINGAGMGLSTTVVLLFSNLIISALRKVIPDRVRIPAYIVIVATLVTIVQLLLQAYVPSLYAALGIYIPLIVVNCIILGRAESYASKNGVFLSTFDGIGMGLGFTIALTSIGLVREILGSGSAFGFTFVPEAYRISIFVLAPGAFFVLSILTALQNKFKAPSATNGSVPQSKLACGGNCASCTGSSCMANHEILETRERQAEEKALAAKKAELAKKEAALKEATSKKDE